MAGYQVEHEDVVAFLKQVGRAKADEKVGYRSAQQRFAEWAVSKIAKNEGGNRMVPWPQCTLFSLLLLQYTLGYGSFRTDMVRKDKVIVTCLLDGVGAGSIVSRQVHCDDHRGI